jgi:sterol desaturase/sphingolipid hydroxylase (fatty acid hydroxylase superfamily)
MTHYEIDNIHQIDHSDTPIRLFKSDFLEFFTHISPITVTVIWLPFAIYMLYRGFAFHPADVSLIFIPIAFLLGVFIWTPSEYLLHRFVFHFKARNPAQERMIYLFHGIHHHQPQCKTRLVMPPVVSIPLSAVFYGLFTLIFATLLGVPHWVGPVVSGFTIGYLTYDLTHYATHHMPLKTHWFKFLKRYHMLHHFRTPSARYGVSSPLWDIVFGTKPASDY